MLLGETVENIDVIDGAFRVIFNSSIPIQCFNRISREKGSRNQNTENLPIQIERWKNLKSPFYFGSPKIREGTGLLILFLLNLPKNSHINPPTVCILYRSLSIN